MIDLRWPMALCLLICQSVGAEETISTTGIEVPELASFDRHVSEVIRRWQIPGGAIAVAKDGRLLLARGYGLADIESKEPVRAESRFRIASLSKPITAASVLVLVEQGKLRLDDRLLDRLPSVKTPGGRPLDPRFEQITLRQLLQHTGGFDRSASFDPMFIPERIARELQVRSPPDARQIVRFMFGQPLDFDPGTYHAYSNFGYCLLGRVIEESTKQSYEEAVKRLVLKPAGIDRMQIGRTRLTDRVEGEVRYYAPLNAKPVESILPGPKDLVSTPYGSFCLEPMDAHGGWIASAVDLVRFVTTLDGSRSPKLLHPKTVRQIEARPQWEGAEKKAVYYGLGWLVRPVGKKANWFHTGGLPGTSTLLVRTHHGMAWAVLFNRRPAKRRDLIRQIDQTMWKAYREVTTWPDHDLFDSNEQ